MLTENSDVTQTVCR